MSLLYKSLVFLLSIIVLQIAIFGGLALALQQAEHETQLAAYSNRAIAAANSIEQMFTEMTSSLVLWAATNNSTFRTKFQNLRDDLPKRLKELQEEPLASSADKVDLEAMSNSLSFILHDMASMEHLVGKQASSLDFLRGHRMIQLMVRPHVIDLSDHIQGFIERHKSVEKKIAPGVRSRQRLQQILIGGFLLDVVLTAFIVVTASLRIISRLSVIADNFMRYAKGTALHPIQPGSDEICTLDEKFHTLSASLTEAAAKDAAVFSSTPVGLITFATDRTIETFNPKSLELVGFRPARLDEMFVEQAELDKLIDHLDKNTHELLRARLRKAAGSSFPAELSTASFTHAGETRFLLAFMDVSAREQIEQLRQEFVSVVSHDIKTPLTSITTCLELFSEGTFGDLNEAGKELLDSVKREADRLLRLAGDLLDVARMEAGNVALNIEKCDVQYLMERAEESVQLIAEERRMEIEILSTEIDVYGDPERIIQILVNFLTNAIKYSPQASRIQLTAEEADAGVYIRVKDQGRGISKEHVSSLFDRFKQVRAEDAKQGTGFGLAICKLLAESHRGRVGVDSDIGVGSTFWLWLPKQLSG